jgi:HAD superfamily hydrolase (TIGR01509 family)
VIPAFQVYIFDIDGTLMDSARDICGAIQEVLAANGRTDVSHEFLRRYIGRHLIHTFVDVGFEQEQIEPMIAHYRRAYLERSHTMTSVFPGVAEMLAALGGKKSTATIKSTTTTRAVLEKFGLLRHFDHVQGTDGFPAKPEPDVVLKSLEVFGVRPEDCLLVGDAPSDIEAGRRAGVKTCAVRYGYGDPEELERWKPDFWIADPRELIPKNADGA